jgi:hypothetical protein
MLEIRGTAGDRTIPLSLDDSFYPPARWERGELVRTQFRQPLDLAPGRYQLRIGVASQRADLASIDVRP